MDGGSYSFLLKNSISFFFRLSLLVCLFLFGGTFFFRICCGRGKGYGRGGREGGREGSK